MRTTPVPSPEARLVWDEFVAELREAHIKAGRPTYREMEQRSWTLIRTSTDAARRTVETSKLSRSTENNKFVVLTKTTLCRVLNGNVEPKWEFIATFLSACGLHSEIIMEVWHPKWTRLVQLLHPYVMKTPGIAAPAGAPPGFTCPKCGCWVTDEKTHDNWHTTIEMGRRRNHLSIATHPRPAANMSPAAGRTA